MTYPYEDGITARHRAELKLLAPSHMRHMNSFRIGLLSSLRCFSLFCLGLYRQLNKSTPKVAVLDLAPAKLPT